MSTESLFLVRVRLVVTEPDSTAPRPSWSNIRVTIMDGHAVALHRRKERRTGEVASIESTGIKDEYTITMTSGEVWETRGCGCGGR